MKLPFASNQNIPYEPKPVVEIDQKSTDDPLPFEEWDSLMTEFGLQDDDDPTKSSNHSQMIAPTMSLFLPSEFDNPNSIHFMNPYHADHTNDPNETSQTAGLDFVDELIRIAECLETQSFQLAQVILARLNHRLPVPNGKPLQRAAFYFKEAIQNLLTGSTRPTGSSEIIQTIKAYKTFSTISPIPMFANFTANQAILEAVDGAMIVHVIDFDIHVSMGGHWASFMKEIAEKAELRKVNSPAFRITAIVLEEHELESRLISDNLRQFARDLKLRFDIEFVTVETFRNLSFKSVKFYDGERIAILLSPVIFQRIGVRFIDDMRGIAPHVIVHVDGEGMSGGTTSFRQTVIEGLEFYSTVLESLEAVNVGIGMGGGDWMRKIEVFVLLPKITAVVEGAGHRVTPWKEVFGRAGMRLVGQSQFADFQAECLLRRIQVRGFHVAKQQGEMVLCWHDRPLVSTSAWRC
ncbi:scarecrow-like protein 15 [Rutidosis leptorrhynchoides]|uniref:scarecrow-like protein 15 n=1 Tax=Rutidosis leptorrhynchoides TaxID=125765 RepID=UPI003A994948